MNKEAQRIAISEACGLNDIKSEHGYAFDGPHYLVASSSMGDVRAALPEYTKDLNAMHDAEKVLTEEQLHIYGHFLAQAVIHMLAKGWWDVSADETAKIAHATAAQRAEAFLRTLNLWTPSP